MHPLEIKCCPVVLCSCCCFATIFGIIALPLSFKSLEQGRQALELSWTTQAVASSAVTDPGIKLVGLGNMLIEFPATLQTMYFVSDTRGITGSEEDVHKDIIRGPIKARSRDGLEMTVSCSFQWQLSDKALHPLYDILGGGELEDSFWRDEFIRFARAAIVESSANFKADSFFVNRTIITDDMLSFVRSAFAQPTSGLDVTVTGFQLREVDLPQAFDDELVKTQEQNQEVLVAYAEREEQKVIKSAELMVAHERVKQVEQEALAAAEQTRINNDAVVLQMLVFAQKQADANALILGKFLSDPDPYARLFEIMEIRALNAHNSTNLLINL